MKRQPKYLSIKPITLLIFTLLSEHAFAAEEERIAAPAVPVTGNPLGVSSDELVVSVSVLKGRELSLKRGNTLGETLNSIPGVSATNFGPNASRPVIRGLDAERVRIMQNGVGILDASSLSFDHAVAIDPLIIEQIDVVRGPAALLYGGSAVGGVVNAIDHRIPKDQLNGITGRGEVRFGGPDSTRNGVAVVDVGNGQFALHADVYSRKTSDLDIPGKRTSSKLRAQQAADGVDVDTKKNTLPNSSADANGGALGAAITLDNGYVGLSYAADDNNYGVVAEEGVRIDLRNRRWDVASEFSGFDGIIKRVKVRMAHTDYMHQEIEDGAVGTTFKNKGVEGAFEVGHASIGNMNGVIGFQFQNTDFEALGEEAFVPSTSTVNKSLYVYEELPIDAHKITFGARVGHASVDSKTNDKFVGQNNSFTPTSFALGGLYSINPEWSLTSNLSHNERAPSYFELYANGAHVATGQFEVGNTNFDVERSNGIDAQVRWKSGQNSLTVGAYYTRFSNFIGLFNTGNEIDVDGELFPEAQFSQVKAVFKGLELEGKFGLTDNLGLKVRGDYVHARNKETGDYLPRISPLRLGAGLNYSLNALSAQLDVLHAFDQNKTASNATTTELATDGYTNVSATVAYKLTTKFGLELFARANNLLNDEIREHTSFLKDIAPQGERSALVGLRGEF